MDKYEYKLKMDEMKSLSAGGRNDEAVEIADTINWHKIKNANDLMRAGEVYERAERYEESKELFLMAYGRSSISRTIIYHLAEVAIKMGNFEEAEDYYQEFVGLAPRDNLKYVLNYQINRAKGADVHVLIGILEELKEQEYSEEWSYELIKLYRQAGMEEKCVDACDELILWFGDGPYVERALEIKMLYQPLNEKQEEKYRQFRQEKEGITEVKPKEKTRSGELLQETVRIPKVQVSADRFNTINLQAELQKGLRQIMEATEKSGVHDGVDSIMRAVEEVPSIAITKEFKLPEPVETSAEEVYAQYHPAYMDMIAEERDGQMSLMIPDSVREPQISGQMNIGDLIADWEAAQREADRRNLEAARARAMHEAGEIMEQLAAFIPVLDSGITPQELLRQYSEGSEIEEKAAADLVVSMNQLLQQQIDIYSQEKAWYDEKLAAVHARIDEESLSKPQQSGEEVKAAGEQSTAADSIVKEPLNITDVAAGEQPEATRKNEFPEDEFLQEIGESIETYLQEAEGYTGDIYPQVNPRTAEDIALQKSKSLQSMDMQDYDELGQEYVPEDIIFENIESQADKIAEEIIQQTEEEREEAGKSGARQTAVTEMPAAEKVQSEVTQEKVNHSAPLQENTEFKPLHELSKEQRKIFKYFVSIKGMEKQLCLALSGAAESLNHRKTSAEGNLMIQGEQGSGKTVLAKAMAKALKKTVGRPSGKVGTIEAAKLNRGDVAAMTNFVAGGCLIIEKVGEISKNTAEKMAALLSTEGSGLFVIIEDTRAGITKAFAKSSAFASCFSYKVTIPIFTNDELVAFAKAYSNELGYAIDEMGMLALYNRISSIQKLDHATTLTEIKEIVDAAISRVEKGGLKKIMSIMTSSRYDAEDYVILHEKDFNA